MATTKTKLWLKRIGIAIGILFLLYVLIGFFGVPLALRHVALKMVNQQLAGTMEVAAFRTNPFTWELKVQGLTGRAPDGEVALSFKEFRVNVQPTSVFGKAFVVKEILLDEFQLNLVVNEDGSVNVQSALAKLQEQVEELEEDDPTKPLVIPAIHVESLRVVNAGIRCEINSLQEPFVRQVDHLSFVMENLRTTPDHHNPYTFELETARGERVGVTGSLKLDPLSSTGKLTLEDIEMGDFLHFAGDQVGFDVHSGTMDFSISYSFVPLGSEPELALRDGAFALRDFVLVPRGGAEPFQSIERLEITGMGVDLLNDSVSLKTFELENSLLKVVRDSEGVLNLLRYVTPPEKQAAVAAQAQQEKAVEAAQREFRLNVIADEQDLGVALTSAWAQIQDLVEVKWDLAADEVTITNQSLIWRDEFLARPAELRWTAINLKASQLSNGEQPFPFDLGLRMNETGSISLDGTFTPTPAASAFKFEVTELPLHSIGPYLDGVAPLRLESGALGAQGQGEIAFPDEGLPKLSARVEGSVQDFALNWAESDAPFLAWEQVSVEGVSMGTDPLALAASLVKVVGPKIWAERDAEGKPVLPLPPAKEEASGTPKAPEPKPAEEETPMSVSIEIDQVEVADGRIHIRDQSVQPAAEFAIAGLTMSAGPLAFPESQPARLDLRFELADGPSGGVKIAGSAQPLKPMDATEVSIMTDSVTLPAFAAYAIPIIGRPPTEGRLTADLGYSITGGQLEGKNSIKIKNMEFGPRAKDTKAPDLPLELGVAILEDSQGFMNIDVPVSGNVNDPKFSVDQMIQYALGNVLEKLVTAPFNALGSVFGGAGEEPTKFVEFQPGQSTLPADAQPGLKALAAVLSDRPLLALELTPSVDPEADAEAIRSGKFDRILAEKTAQGIPAAEAINQLYAALPRDLQRPVPEGQVEIPIDQKRAVVRESIPVTFFDLGELAQARAKAVQQVVLTDGTLTADRVIIAEDEERSYASDGARVDFGLGVAKQEG